MQNESHHWYIQLQILISFFWVIVSCDLCFILYLLKPSHNLFVNGIIPAIVITQEFPISAVISVCSPCSVGFYTKHLSHQCRPCAPWTYITLPGQGVCRECLPGTYQSQAGQSACLACESGSIAASTGLTSCELCPPGQYQVCNCICTDTMLL